MKSVLLAALISIACLGCASAAQVDFTCTLPLFAADSVNCNVALPDTLKNLSTVAVYVSTTAALSDSVLLLSQSVVGQEGKPFNFSAQQATWTTRYYWLITRDLLNHRSCKSNVAVKTVTAGGPKAVSDLHPR